MPRPVTGRSVIKTAMKMKASSLPKASVNSYLDLYVLTRKRTKLELEMQALIKRKNSIQDELDDLAREIRAIEKTVMKQDRKRDGREVARKGTREPFKTIVMDY